MVHRNPDTLLDIDDLFLSTVDPALPDNHLIDSGHKK
jgi:hypothetical protein